MAKKRKHRYRLQVTCQGMTKNTFADSIYDLQVFKLPKILKRHWNAHAIWKVQETDQVSPTFWQGRTVTNNYYWVNWQLTDMHNELKSAAAKLGAVGGRNGTGKAKRRGDSAYYRNLRLLGQLKKEIKKLKNLDDNKNAI